MLRGRTHLLQPARAPLAASRARDAHPAPGAGARGRARPGAGSRGAPARGLCSAARGNRGAKASPPFSPEPPPNSVTCAGSRGDSRAGGGCTGPGRAAGAYRSLVIRPGLRAGAGQSRPARCSAGARGAAGPRAAWRSGHRDYSYRRGRRARPDCGLGLPQSGSLKGPRPLGLRLPLRLAAAATRGQSGRGPETSCRADLRVLGLGSRKGLRNGNTQGGLRWDPGRTHLARDRACGSSASQSREQN